MRRRLLCVAVLSIATVMAGQELPRHPVLGFTVASVPSNGTGALQKGALVKEVAANLQSSPGQIKVGDVITQIGNSPIAGPDDISTALQGLSAGRKVEVTLQRNVQTLQTRVTLQSAAYESLPSFNASQFRYLLLAREQQIARQCLSATV